MTKSLGRLGFLVALLISATAGSAVAASEAEVNASIARLLGHAALYENTLKAFQQAVASGNKEDAAAFIRYPIPVEIDRHKRSIRSSAEFVKNYDRIMTPDIVAAVKNQTYEDLTVSRKGVSFGKGEVLVTGMCLDRGCRTMVPVVVSIQHADVN